MACGNCGKFLHGSVGLFKAAVGMDRAPDAVIALRQAICRPCPKAEDTKKQPGKVVKCGACGCWLGPKVKIASESCPLGRWTRIGKEPEHG